MDSGELDWISGVLACPYCHCLLKAGNAGLICEHCAIEFPNGPAGQPDLRLSKPVEIHLHVTYDPSLCIIPERVWCLPDAVHANMNQAKQLMGRPQQDLKAWLLTIIKPGMVVLDLGSKSNRDKKLIESLGAKYLAVEINAPDAMILGDAHAIPLLDHAVDVVISMSVFEHLKNPFLAALEVQRVLKPGGYFVGIVGFLEPVHGLPHGSFFHHSYFGIYTLLKTSRFRVEYLHPGWLPIRSIIYGMLIGIPKPLLNAITLPFIALQNIVWDLYGLKIRNIGEARSKKQRILSASYHFVAVNEKT